MSNWLTQLQQFWSAAQKTPQIAPVHELLTRSQRFNEAYAGWDKNLVIEALRQAYQQEIMGEKSSIFTRIDGPTAAGLQWHKPPHLADNEFDFLAEYTKDLLLALGYVLHQADRRIFNREKVVEEVHRYYLKARTGVDTLSGNMSQRWGNILIEVIRVNGQVAKLKIQLNRYSDRAYAEAQSFDSLMTLLMH
jgi:hypothetical protein